MKLITNVEINVFQSNRSLHFQAVEQHFIYYKLSSHNISIQKQDVQ